MYLSVMAVCDLCSKFYHLTTDSQSDNRWLTIYSRIVDVPYDCKRKHLVQKLLLLQVKKGLNWNSFCLLYYIGDNCLPVCLFDLIFQRSLNAARYLYLCHQVAATAL